jgi:hypothetical protein
MTLLERIDTITFLLMKFRLKDKVGIITGISEKAIILDVKKELTKKQKANFKIISSLNDELKNNVE